LIAFHELKHVAVLNELLAKTEKSAHLIVRPRTRPPVATLKRHIGRFLLVDTVNYVLVAHADDLHELEQRIIEREAA
jgi:hypothetical protein